MNKTIIDAFMHRYAVKTFDSSKSVSAENLETILESARLSATSYGLQPFRLIHVTDKVLREQIKPVSYGQTQVTDAAELIVIARVAKVDEAYIEKYIAHIAEVRAIPKESLDGFLGAMKGALGTRSVEDMKAWSSKQSYIALGSMLETAALLGVDTCAMEGFDSKAVDEILGLTELGLESVAFLPVGYRSETDATADYKKVRLEKSEFLIVK